jgi:hypothetical protein
MGKEFFDLNYYFRLFIDVISVGRMAGLRGNHLEARWIGFRSDKDFDKTCCRVVKAWKWMILKSSGLNFA